MQRLAVFVLFAVLLAACGSVPPAGGTRTANAVAVASSDTVSLAANSSGTTPRRAPRLAPPFHGAEANVRRVDAVAASDAPQTHAALADARLER
jgi:hypothetical protein